jgi:tetratricopeptide (TPR) repeat protein
MRKWVRRHRLATGTAVGVLVLIVASAIGLGILWGIANRNWERAEKRLATFRETLQEINPETGRGASDMTALGFLDLVEESAEARATGDLAVAASLLNSVQGIRLAFRPRELREEPLQRALSVSRELAQSRGVSDAPEVAEALHNLGRYAIQTDNLPLAEARYGEAIGMYERLYGRDAPESARSLQHLASCLRRQKKLDEAEALYERTLAIQRTAHGEASEEVAALLNGKGFVRRERGDLEGALRLFEQATASIRASKGAEDFRVGSGLYNVGQTKRQLRRYEEAIVDLREAVRVLSERMGDRSTPTIDARRELARTLLESGGPADEAVGHAQAVVAAQVALEAPPERLADAFELVAMTQLAAHRPEEAISTWREAMQRAPAKAAAIEQRAKAALVSAGQESFVDRLKPDDVGASPSR